ncbi:hypothetical protein AR687_03165 [Flavobacteriaceae bacterium CRH]|nr:hypothetical protein AR687_03165 [Flavobacteriaceae bacterium CRH]
MKKLKDLIGVEVLGVNEKKNINGGGVGAEACYCPGTNILAGIIHPNEGETCGPVIEEGCPLDS